MSAAASRPEVPSVPFERPPNPPGTGRLGLSVFLISLAVLFASSVVGVLVVRFDSPNWRSEGAPQFPDLAWVSTGVLLLISVGSHLAYRAVQVDRQLLFRSLSIFVLSAGIAFLVLQKMVWQILLEGGMSLDSGLYSYSLFMLSALHAVHVVGGLVMQVLVIVRGLGGRYWSLHCEMVRHAGVYWHFLDGVWVALFLFLLWLH
ncbi:MAG TPA: hypothetical protein EYN79_02570 [Planctomycetes bacterium]|nr:hypothetical protein [Planctomycetota bacterium]HIN80281.1 hypothetical protein [Planctomycetota bacterium]